MSMTGFGRGEVVSPDYRITAELRSVNNRYGDIVIHMPRSLMRFEQDLREVIQTRVSRGRVELFLDFRDLRTEEGAVNLNLPLALSYDRSLRELAERLGVPYTSSVEQLALFKGVLDTEPQEIDADSLRDLFVEAVGLALDELTEMRRREGAALETDLRERLAELSAAAADVEIDQATEVNAWRRRLTERLEQVLNAEQMEYLGESRIVAEVALYADKADVNEEIQRLRSHIDMFDSLLSGESPIGKQLDFVLQEMNRELNTLGSKSVSRELTAKVIEQRSIVERMREQVQNIE
ncbi:MAG: YicC family protein [Clostridiaceae bacterium]|nr:YicC family protein [Clostridiaceae bacterium]